MLRIDADKIQEVMPPDVLKQYKELQAQGQPGGRRRRRPGRRACRPSGRWKWNRAREMEKSYILTSGDPERPEKDKPVEPGWPFAPAKIDFREGRIETFSDWLTAPENPMFARVAVNRLWQWHFGEGLQKNSSDFGMLGGTPSHPQLLDWLASEFVARKFSMKEMHRLMVTSDTYKLASEADPVASWRRISKPIPQDTLSVALPRAAAGSGAGLGFDSDRCGQSRPDRRRPVFQHRRPADGEAEAAADGSGGCRERGESPRRVHDARLLHELRSDAEFPAGRSTWMTGARRARCGRRPSRRRKACS